MRITVELMAQLRVALGATQVRVEVEEGATLQDVLRKLLDECDGDRNALLLTADGSLSPTVIASVHGRALPNGAEVILTDGDTISLFSPIAGG